MGITTIQIKDEVLRELKKEKQYERQTYSELLIDLIKVKRSWKSMNQYDEYLHRIQQEKMKELWDNKEDEEWENV